MTGFYTYLHVRKSDDKVFYIGKGRGPRAHSAHGRSEYWKRVAAKHGFQAEVVAHWTTEEEAFLHERFLISCFADMKVPLVNLTLGGEGASGSKHSTETRQKMSLAHTGKKLPPKSAEHRAKLSKAQTGKSPGNKGLSPSDEVRARLSLAKMGRKIPLETRQKMSAAHKGRKKSPETRARMSASRIGKPMSDATKAKLSALAKARAEAKRRLMTNNPSPEIIGLEDRIKHINHALAVLT
jgi:hypothetical protein